MKTLYDLLGALPDDDAESLRTAFRSAVKGAHPDIHPNDPDAALKFRQIIRANEILRDTDQRAAYDHLLDLARLEQVSTARHALAARVYKLAFGVVALAGVSVATVGAYVLLTQVSTATIAPTDQIETLARGSPEIEAITLAERWALNDPAAAPNDQAAPAAKDESATVSPEATAPGSVATAEGSVAPQATAEAATPAAAAGPGHDPSEASRERGIAAYRNGDLDGAIAEFDLAIQLNPKFKAAYIDRGIILYRMRKFDRAFADIEKAKRIDRAGHGKPESVAVKKPRSQAGTENGASQMLQQRTDSRSSPRNTGVAFAKMP
jgi:tetratricopeptide (TPR) repeat protein